MTHLPSILITLLLSLTLQSPSTDARIDRNAPHSHKGKASPYTPGPFTSLTVSTDDEKSLADGNSVMKQIPGENGQGGRAICVQDVNAPSDAVWNQILNVDSYVGKVSKLKECKNYLVKKLENGNYRIKTKMVVGVLPGYSYEYYCDHTYFPKENSLTWSLDYDKTSDFDDVAGHWHLEDHPSKAKCTRVFYACDIKFKKAVPKPIMNFLTKSALRAATGWVKRESEEKPAFGIPSEFAAAGAF